MEDFSVAAFRLLYPEEFFSKFLSEGVRPDGRPLGRVRPSNIGFGAVQTADGSALVKVGNTTMIAAVKLEVMTPNQEAPDVGVIEIEFDMPPLCSARTRPGRTSENVHLVAEELRNVISSSKLLNLEDLCIEPGKAAWLARVDILCLDDDGALMDAALLALVASLADLKLPSVKMSKKGKVVPKTQGNNSDMETDIGEMGEKEDNERSLKLGSLPVALTCALHGHHFLVDPSAEELSLAISTVTVVVDNNFNLLSVLKLGGTQNASISTIQDCITAAKLRNKEVSKLLLESSNGINIPAVSDV